MRQSKFAAILSIAALCATASFAQQSTNRVAAQTDWSVFVEKQPAGMLGRVGAEADGEHPRRARVVSVRGDILLFVSYRPAAGVNGEVSFTGGYPFAEGSTVSARDRRYRVRALHRWRMGMAREPRVTMRGS
jgi:hypothetical protein